MSGNPTDLLLLNCSNYPEQPVYPYAFVQVSEVARRFGLSVRRLDLLDVAAGERAERVRRLVAECSPRMIGFHLRQVDSLRHVEYVPDEAGGPAPTDYFPADDTRQLIAELRSISAAPIAVGGFGFSTQPARLLDFLGADFGMCGAPDGLFERFDQVLRGERYAHVPGLVYREAGAMRVNDAAPAGPAAGREYTDEIADELEEFYVRHVGGFRSPRVRVGQAAPTVPIEVMRGCPFRCYFCTEPKVKGRRVLYRDLDVVMEDVEFVMRRRLERIWFICSELNVHGSDFAVALAERMLRLAEQRPECRPAWTAYLLPRIEDEALRILFRSGFFFGGANDPLSLDDDNLRRAKVPYRARHVVSYFKRLAVMSREAEAAGDSPRPGRDEKLRRLSLFADRMPLRRRTPDARRHTQLFLGNAFADAGTIRTTLERLNAEGLSAVTEVSGANGATRVFDVLDDYADVDARRFISVGRDGSRTHNLVWPTFHYPEPLMQQLGSRRALREFLAFVSATLMSTAHRFRKNWGGFLSRHASEAAFMGMVSQALDMRTPAARDLLDHLPEARALLDELIACPSAAAIGRLFAPAGDPLAPSNVVAGAMLAHVFDTRIEAVIAVLDRIGIPHEDGFVAASEYDLMRLLYAKYDSTSRFVAEVAAQLLGSHAELQRLYLDYLVYLNGVVIRAEWRSLLFD